MKTIFKYLPIFFLLLSCEKEPVQPKTDPYDFSFTVEAVDGIKPTTGEFTEGFAFITIDKGERTNYSLVFQMQEGESTQPGDKQYMQKLWPGVPRKIPVLRDQWGFVTIAGTVSREDGLGEKKEFSTKVYVRGEKIYNLSESIKSVADNDLDNENRSYREDLDNTPTTLYRWDTLQVSFGYKGDTRLELKAECNNSDVLQILNPKEKEILDPGDAFILLRAAHEGTANVKVSLVNGNITDVWEHTFNVVMDTNKVDHRVVLDTVAIASSLTAEGNLEIHRDSHEGGEVWWRAQDARLTFSTTATVHRNTESVLYTRKIYLDTALVNESVFSAKDFENFFTLDFDNLEQRFDWFFPTDSLYAHHTLTVTIEDKSGEWKDSYSHPLLVGRPHIKLVFAREEWEHVWDYETMEYFVNTGDVLVYGDPGVKYDFMWLFRYENALSAIIFYENVPSSAYGDSTLKNSFQFSLDMLKNALGSVNTQKDSSLIVIMADPDSTDGKYNYILVHDIYSINLP